jgi:acetate kinase
MCDAALDPASDAIDARIKADGWTVVGLITGADDVIASPPAAGLRQSMIRPGPDRKRYGFLAKSDTSELYVAAIRGTDGAEEWIDDVVFIADRRPPFPGRVETGFADIYLSMQYRPLGSATPQRLADGVKATVGATADLLVLGHSLGSALAESLSFELADPTALGAGRVGAIMFASPKLGDHDFVDGFARRVGNYTVINYERDVVPRVPPFDITHLDLYRPLPFVVTITDATASAVIDGADKGCCHYLIDYVGMLSLDEYARAANAPGWTADDRRCAKCVLSLRACRAALSADGGFDADQGASIPDPHVALSPTLGVSRFAELEGVPMREPILVLNAGSSSIKFSLFATAEDRTLVAGAHGQVEGIGASARFEATDDCGGKLAEQRLAGNDYQAAIAVIHDWCAGRIGGEAGLAGVGHRVVHGGSEFSRPVLIDEHVIAALEALVPLAPLHQPHHIAAIRAVAAAAPEVPQIACFDTSFHHGQPPVARHFALPRELTAKGIIRYGFHGLSYEYIVSALPEIAPACARGKLVVGHLGNGASLCAIDDGRSIATTMGFTPVDGLVMGTRTGLLDPGVILYLLRHEGMDAARIETLINENSGLLGVSGLSGDMRELLASDRPEAREAIDLFVYRIGRELGSLVAALGGLDALVFTGGIGEHAAEIRARVCRGAAWLGVRLDEAANRTNGPCISPPGAAASAWVVPTNENLMIARHTRRLLDNRNPG